MIRVSQLKLPVEHSEEQFYQKIEKSLKIKRDQIKKLQIVKTSMDARKRDRSESWETEESDSELTGTGGFHCLFRRCMGG